MLLEKAVPVLSEEKIQQVLADFTGDLQQVPPMYSALKKDGRPLYELARQGIEIEREARPMTIDAIKLLSFSENSLTLDITCSKGTYIRVLGEDIAQALGTYGHLTYLHRIKTGHFDLIPSYTIEYLESLSELEREVLLLPVFAPVDHFLKIQAPEGRAEYFSRGMESNIEHEAAAEVLVFDEIDVGISGGTAEIVGRLLAGLGQHVQILCITHQAQVAAQSDQHLLVKKQQTDPASSTILMLQEEERILELARMTGGVEINETTLQHAKQLRQLKFQSGA